MEQQWSEEGEEDETKKKRKAVSSSSGEWVVDKRGWRESLSCGPYLNGNPVEGIFRSLLTRVYLHHRNIHPAGFCPGHFYSDFNALFHRAVAFHAH